MASIRKGESTTRPPILDGTSYAYQKNAVKFVVKLYMSFKCRECEEYDYYQVECPAFLKRKKKRFGATLSDEESNDSDVEGEYTKVFVNILSRDDFVLFVQDLSSHKENTLSYDQLQHQWEEKLFSSFCSKGENTGVVG